MFEVLRIITLTLRIFMIVTKVRSVQINEFIHVTEKLFMNTRYQISKTPFGPYYLCSSMANNDCQ